MKIIVNTVSILILIVIVLYGKLGNITGNEMLYSIISYYIIPILLGFVMGLFYKSAVLPIIALLIYSAVSHLIVFNCLNIQSVLFTVLSLAVGVVIAKLRFNRTMTGTSTSSNQV